METTRQTHGWSGSIRKFLDQPGSLIEESLEAHLQGLLGFNAAGSQIEAWFEEPGREDNCGSDPYGETSPESVLNYLRK